MAHEKKKIVSLWYSKFSFILKEIKPELAK